MLENVGYFQGNHYADVVVFVWHSMVRLCC